MSVRIIVDSSCDITQADNLPVDVLPLSIAFGETVYHEGVDLTHKRFYELLVESDELPTTGQVNPYAFEQAISRAREAGDEVVVITLSAKLSGTHESAIAAAAGFGEGVYVVDSKNVTVGARILVEYALSLVGEGKGAAEIAHALEEVRERVCLVAMLDTLEYLRRGGRVPAAAAAVGQLLAIKPVVEVVDGEVCIKGKARGSKSGRSQLNRAVERSGIDFAMPVALGYTGLSQELLDKYIDDSEHIWASHFSRAELPVHCVGSTIGTHVGPGAIAVAFFAAQ